MKTKCLTVFLVSLFLVTLSLGGIDIKAQEQTAPDVYVGVHLGYGDVAETKALIDRLASPEAPCANFVLIGTSRIFYNGSKLNETFQYAYDKGMYFMSFTPQLPYGSFNSSMANQTEWFRYANETWGNHLVGFYQDDEPGGKALDGKTPPLGRNGTMPQDSVEAAYNFYDRINRTLVSTRVQRLDQNSYPLFTADYGLYWFDYKGGYDGLFAQFVANYSRQMTVALVRGAAEVQGKEWGILIGWKYSVPPYLESGEELYKDMVYAYDSGAKYILIFDANEGWTQDILQPEHILAMQQFWAYVQNNPRQNYAVSQRTALILPEAYGCGFRWPGDKIWGIWYQDDTSKIINAAIGHALDEYGNKLDIIYDDSLGSANSYEYSQLLNWNDSSLQPTPSPSPTPVPTPTPTASPTPSPTPSPSPSPTPTPSPSPPPTPTPSLTPDPTASPDPPLFLPSEYVYLIFAGVIAAVVPVMVFLIRKRQ